jgi:hypothetical protein
MTIIDLFSKRKKLRESQGKAEVYQYENLPEPFRIQVSHIWKSALGLWYRDTHSYSYAGPPDSPSSELWEGIQSALAREKGKWNLGKSDSSPALQCLQYLMEADTDGALDIIELSFRVIDFRVRKFDSYARTNAHVTQTADDAVKELNGRFREHGIGYQYVDGQIVRVDSQFLHAEAVKPALALLHQAGFSGPSDEFMRAFDHHRKGEIKDAIADALSAFESTMKAICASRKWVPPPNATATPLIDFLLKKGLIPSEMQTHFGALRATLESGLPTLANKTSRHGQGPTPVEIPPHYAAYALHLVASNIVFLIECHKALK